MVTFKQIMIGLGWSLFVLIIASGVLSLILLPALGQPQPPIDVSNEPDWYLLEFDNGAQWYIDETKLTAIQAIPEADAKKLGYRTRLYGTGYTINCPLTLQEVITRMEKTFPGVDQ